jgi:hypothetical protein
VHQISITRIMIGVIGGLVISAGAAAVVVAVGIFETRARAEEPAFSATHFIDKLSNNKSSRNHAIRALDERPPVNQDSIEKAIKFFEIRMPKNVKGPFLDEKLDDRGMTVRNGVVSDVTVYIGPEAFTSWALLGSTLAHEIEVHCRQNFLAIHFQNLAGFDGIGDAEREAYSYELNNSRRFGLSEFDQHLIRSTMTYYYPDHGVQLVQRLLPVRAWFDRLAAEGRANVSF